MELATPRIYAGLWPRTAAFAFDYVLIAAYIAVLVAVGALVRGIAPGLVAALFGNPVTGEFTGFVTLTLPVLLYFALSEATQAGATWGKRRLRLRVGMHAYGGLGFPGRCCVLPRSSLPGSFPTPSSGNWRRSGRSDSQL